MPERESYTIKIGPLLKQVLDRQRKIIQDVLHGVDDTSYWVAGEILAKKINS